MLPYFISTCSIHTRASDVHTDKIISPYKNTFCNWLFKVIFIKTFLSCVKITTSAIFNFLLIRIDTTHFNKIPYNLLASANFTFIKVYADHLLPRYSMFLFIDIYESFSIRKNVRYFWRMKWETLIKCMQDKFT